MLTHFVYTILKQACAHPFAHREKVPGIAMYH